MGFVFLALLDGGLMLVEVVIIREALDFLANKVAIRHGMADGSHFIAKVAEDKRYPTRRLTFTRPGPYCADRDDRFGGLDLGVFRTHQPEVRSQGVYQGGFVHHDFMRHIRIGKDDLFHAVLLDQI